MSTRFLGHFKPLIETCDAIFCSMLVYLIDEEGDQQQQQQQKHQQQQQRQRHHYDVSLFQANQPRQVCKLRRC